MVTKYPAQIDNSTTLPTLVDGVTGINVDVVNRLRDAIVAVEEELGVEPASVYTTVRERLEAIEDSISNLEIISLSGDLGGTLASPKVIGLQGISVGTTTPDIGQFLGFNGLAWVPSNAPSGSFAAGGDLSGSSSNQTVTGLQGNDVSAVAPGDGYILGWSTLSDAWISELLTNSNIAPLAGIDYSKLGGGLQSLSAQQFTTTVDSKGTAIDVQPKNVPTTTATVTTLDSFTIASGTTLIVSAVITGIKSDSSQGAAYIRTAAFRNNAGTVAQISTTQDGGTFEDDGTWDATIDNSTTTIRIRVTGKAATTIRWTCISTRLEVIN